MLARHPRMVALGGRALAEGHTLSQRLSSPSELADQVKLREDIKFWRSASSFSPLRNVRVHNF